MENILFNQEIIKGRKVLVVEHDDRNYFLIERIFAHSGLKLLRARYRKEAIHMCAKCYDIVFINIDIPYLDVINTAIEIKVSQPELPVIAYTSFYSEEKKKKYLDAGCDRYICKPLQRESLLNEITECLRKKNKKPCHINELAIN